MTEAEAAKLALSGVCPNLCTPCNVACIAAGVPQPCIRKED